MLTESTVQEGPYTVDGADSRDVDAAVAMVLGAYRRAVAQQSPSRASGVTLRFFLEPGTLTDLAHALSAVDGATAAAALAPLERRLREDLARMYLDDPDSWRSVATLIVRTGLGAALSDGAGVNARALYEMLDLVLLQTRWRGMNRFAQMGR